MPPGATENGSDPVAESLREALAERGIDLEAGARRRAEYSFDASNYRVPPVGVVYPRTADDVVTVVRACAAAGVSVIGRGGGTSLAGNAIGPGVIIDFSRHMTALTRVDRDAEPEPVAVVEPGIVLTELQSRVAELTDGTLTFAPDPSSKSRATVGGAIGNDACGNHSVRHGRTENHVVALDVVTASGHRLTATATGLCATDPDDPAACAEAERITRELGALVGDHLAELRLELGRIPRQVSGFHLTALLPENGFGVARSLVGSEGTCAIVVSATVRLVPVPPSDILLCLGYRDLVDAARDTMAILEYDPAALEGIDDTIVATMRRRRGPDAVTGLPDGSAWLYVALDGEDRDELLRRGEELVTTLRQGDRLVDARIVDDPQDRLSLWRVREDGAGLSARTGGTESWTGWEDSAVAPERLADYLDALIALLGECSLTGIFYGHFGAGCMHIRIDFDQRTEQGRAVMADFIERAARLCVEFGGSLSGEHGDGRARSALLPLMYSEAVLAAFAEFKRAWDPNGVLGPHAIVDPRPLTADLALDGVDGRDWPVSFDLSPQRPVPVADFAQAVQSCIGVGRCRTHTGGVMCPSYRATRDEKDSTRGRARALQEMVRSSPSVASGWASEAVRESLDLCLSCKACSSDCPVGVDMATYRSEFFDHYYEGHRRPRSHYSLGWLPRWLPLAARLAPVVNVAGRSAIGRWGARAAGLTDRRAIPEFASHREIREELWDRAPNADTVLFADTFTRAFRPHVIGAARRVLADAGSSVDCRADACCGLPYISTGQLTRARRTLERAAAALDDGTDRPIVVLEPSCAAALREDLPRLVHDDRAARVARRVHSFAEYVGGLADHGWRPTVPIPPAVTVQTHCHEYAVFGSGTQRRALRAVGVEHVREATGCCGVAGNFGFEPDHYEISVAVAEHALAPALRADTTPVLTDGFSCHVQVEHLDPGRTSLHLAQLLDPASSQRSGV